MHGTKSEKGCKTVGCKPKDYTFTGSNPVLPTGYFGFICRVPLPYSGVGAVAELVDALVAVTIRLLIEII